MYVTKTKIKMQDIKNYKNYKSIWMKLKYELVLK